jgi:hypothetical protein
MRALATLALTMVAWLEHPHLTLLLLTLLLRQIHKILKKATMKMTMMSEASRRPPNTFWVLNDKGGEISIKAWKFSSLCSVLFCLEKPDYPVLQTRLSSFAHQN